MKRIFSKLTFGHNYFTASLVYTGLALVMFAITPSQAQLCATIDECGNECEEGTICVGNEETGYYCDCVD